MFEKRFDEKTWLTGDLLWVPGISWRVLGQSRVAHGSAVGELRRGLGFLIPLVIQGAAALTVGQYPSQIIEPMSEQTSRINHL